MRKGFSDRRMIAVLILLLVIEATLLLNHFGFFKGSTQRKDSGVVAGVVEQIENDLRRRNINSLIWEKSEKQEELHFYDSVLTLEKSSARIHLNNGAKVLLSENTLITLEPPRDETSQEVRLVFNHKAINVGAGSEVKVRKTPDGNYEIGVLTGSATYDNGDKVETVKVEEPFAAPKLFKPKLLPRAPAGKKKKDGAFFKSVTDLIFPMAHAESVTYEAEFAWESISGADLYIIEISETEDFKSPLISKKLSKSDFVWRFSKLKNYYWRAAAGTQAGRMGIFSEPTKINFSEYSSTNAQFDGVVVKRIEKPIEKPVEPPPASVVVQPPPPPPAVVVPEKKPEAYIPGSMVFWQPSYLWNKAESEKETFTAGFAGPSGSTVGIENTWMMSEKNYLYSRFLVSGQEFKPDANLTLQKNLQFTEMELKLHWINVDSFFQWGIWIRDGYWVERQSTESLKFTEQISAGPSISHSLRLGFADYVGSTAFLVGSKSMGVGSDHQLRFHFGSTDRWTSGIGISAEYFSGNDQNLAIIRSNLLLGFRF